MPARNTVDISTGGRYLRGRPPTALFRRRSLWLIAGVAAVLFFIIPLLGENGLPSFWRLRQERNRLRADVEQLRQREAELQQRIESLQTDPAALERLARERYNMRRADEEVLEIVADPEPGPSP